MPRPMTRVPSPRRFGRMIWLCFGLALMSAAGCDREAAPSVPALAGLTGRAVLPADTFTDGPSVGHALEPKINGRQLPFASVPAQGFSSLLALGGGRYLALQDNGFGSLANSADFPLRWLRLQVRLDSPPPEGGLVQVLDVTGLTDPLGMLPFRLAHPDSSRWLSGADLDPEAISLMPDGSFWLGEEFGPSLVHVSARGEVLEKPVDIPVMPALRPYARGSPFFRTPDHPDLRFLRRKESREELANLPRSGGIEGLAASPDGNRLYLALEKGMLDDPLAERRVIMEFNPSRRSFTGNHWFYPVDRPDVSLASLEAVDARVLLVVERDAAEGAKAEIKRIYRIELGTFDERGYLRKTLVCDLLNIDDKTGYTKRERGAVGFGRHYRFPYVTPECLVVLNDSTLLVANDNNFPLSAGRRPPSTPDDTEFIRLRLYQKVPTWPRPPE